LAQDTSNKPVLALTSSHRFTATPIMKGVAIALALVSCVSATELTKDNWDKESAGKAVFVKFLAPW